MSINFVIYYRLKETGKKVLPVFFSRSLNICIRSHLKILNTFIIRTYYIVKA